ncbi:helix-turn-helix transcriptional regulator [uncultured Amphritea sp.]|uniref:helix-turn-helix domain-containing protein n=1 Tax=uncultured Amphritea sp. TaxID=981605 RepID=UPI00262D4ACE|nr:helix-turn-helix transcriptional regulator [uncultured Amphritea sp.]
MTSLQKMIKKIRLSGLKGPAIAERINVTQPTVSRIENGARTDYETGKAIERLYSEVVDNSLKDAV